MKKTVLFSLLFFFVSFAQSQNSNPSKKRKFNGSWSLAVIAGGIHLLDYSELQRIPFFLNQPQNLQFAIPGGVLCFGNKVKSFVSLELSFFQASPRYGQYLTHSAIKTYNSTILYGMKLNRVIVSKTKFRQMVAAGVYFAHTLVVSSNVLYYTYPNDTIQYFFSGTFRQKWIMDFSTSLLRISTHRLLGSEEVSFGLNIGYHLDVFKNKIIQKQGNPIAETPDINFSGPYISLIWYAFWTKKKDGV
ncbi:MAG: hypothetical protein AB1458_05960 [Bacteroidota bacterium]